MSTKRTNGSGQFTKGTSGNSSGRPPGSRNRTTLLMESLLEGQAEQLMQKTIELALAGEITALRLCLERIVPPRKERSIHLLLPPSKASSRSARRWRKCRQPSEKGRSRRPRERCSPMSCWPTKRSWRPEIWDGAWTSWNSGWPGERPQPRRRPPREFGPTIRAQQR